MNKERGKQVASFLWTVMFFNLQEIRVTFRHGRDGSLVLFKMFIWMVFEEREWRRQ